MTKIRKNIKSIRVSEDQQQKYTELYGTVYAGATQAADAYLRIRALTLKELKGKFSPIEIHCLIDSRKLTTQEPAYQVQVTLFVTEMKDYYYDRDHLDAITLNDYVGFLNRLSELTAAQVYFLQDEIFRFLNTDSYQLDDFMKLLS